MLLCLLSGFGGGKYREELILNVTLIVVRVWGEQYRGKLILNVTLILVRVWGEQYREKLILNVSVFFQGLVEGKIEWN